MNNTIEVPYQLPEGFKWAEWLGGEMGKQTAGVYDGTKYHIWTYRPDLIGHKIESDFDHNKNASLWRVRINGRKILGYADSFDEACRFISLYMMMEMYNEVS